MTQKITYRGVKGEFNKMAVCAFCGKDASEVRMSYFVESAVEKTPLKCDPCRGLAA